MKILKITLLVVALAIGAMSTNTLIRPVPAKEGPTWDVECEWNGKGELTKRKCKTPGSNDWCPTCNNV